MPKTYTVRQVADLLGYSTNSIYAFLKEGRIKGIRVGKGRFRISQEEIDHLLKISPQTKIQADTTPAPEPEINTQKRLLKIPGLFDWYIGVASVILGASLFLFSKTSENFIFNRYDQWFFSLKVALITSGLGLLISDFVGKDLYSWRKLFRLIMFISYLSLAIIFGLTRDFQAFVIFGSIAFVLGVRFLIKLGSVSSFYGSIFLLLLFVPVSILFSKTFILPEIIASWSINPVIFWLFNFLVVLIGVALLRWARKYSRLVYWLILILSIISLGTLSWWNAQNIYWARALFLLITAVTVLFAPWWSFFNFSLRRDQLVIFSAFAVILSFFLTTILIIHLMQTNLIDYTRLQLKDKVAYGQLLVDDILESTQGSLEIYADHPLLINYLNGKYKESGNLMVFLRLIQASNPNLRRIVIMDKNGDVVAYYPNSSPLQDKNFRFRDYFEQAVTTKKTFISEVIIGVVDEPIVVIAVPIINEEKNLVGLITGALDLNSINNRLQQIANGSLGEYFLLTDSAGNFIAHPDKDSQPTTGPYIQVSQKLIHKPNWTITAQANSSQVLVPGRATLLSVYLVVGLAVGGVVILLLTMYPRIISRIDGL